MFTGNDELFILSTSCKRWWLYTYTHIYSIYSKLRGRDVLTWQLSAAIAIHNHNYIPFLWAFHLPLLSPVNSLPLLLLLTSPSLNSWWKTQSRWKTCSVFPKFLRKSHRGSENLAVSAENKHRGVSTNSGGCRTKQAWESGRGEESRRDEAWEWIIIRDRAKWININWD